MNENKFGGMSQHTECEAVWVECLTGRLSHLRIQSRARMKKSLLSWCSSRRRAHCSNVTDMDVRSLALLQLVNLMPFNLRQIWREVRKRNDNVQQCQITYFSRSFETLIYGQSNFKEVGLWRRLGTTDVKKGKSSKSYFNSTKLPPAVLHK